MLQEGREFLVAGIKDAKLNKESGRKLFDMLYPTFFFENLLDLSVIIWS